LRKGSDIGRPFTHAVTLLKGLIETLSYFSLVLKTMIEMHVFLAFHFETKKFCFHFYNLISSTLATLIANPGQTHAPHEHSVHQNSSLSKPRMVELKRGNRNVRFPAQSKFPNFAPHFKLGHVIFPANTPVSSVEDIQLRGSTK